MQPGAHLDYDDLAAYLDNAMSAEDRERVEAHLSMCDECRAEATAASAAISSVPSLGTRRIRPWRLIGIAAAAGLIIVAGTTLTRGSGNREAVRDASTVKVQPTVTVVTPDDGRQLGNDRKLTWRSVSAESSYRVTLGDDSAQPIYSVTVQDTSIVVPASVPLASGKKFFWYVDAIRPDGVTATSGLKAFTVK